jgi:CubicO group peptidase (beta-lactamase class C family)
MLKSRFFVKVLVAGFAVILVAGVFGYYKLGKIVLVGTGYNAKIVCSSVFVSGRDLADVEKVDLGATAAVPLTNEIDRANKTASSTLFGMFKQTAVYREGLGCTLSVDVSEEELAKRVDAIPKPAPTLPEDVLWPEGEMVDVDNLPAEVDREKLKTAIEFAFTDPAPARPIRTRAVVVIYQGRIIGEKYAKGFSKDTPLLGWSMTKSVTNAMVGILVKQGKLDIYEPALVPEWKKPEDPRSKITLDQLLRMSSGLKFIEEYESNITSDCNLMLFQEPDMGAFAALMPLAAKSDTKWSYSSGTTNIISRIIRQTLGSDKKYCAFAREELFDKLGMRSSVIEPDASGTFVGSSYMYATGRDWARIGLLFLNDGIWQGLRILPEGWVEYSTAPTPKASRGRYGAQLWLNAGTPGKPEERDYPSLPTDLFYMSGHDSQMVAMIPSSSLVIVRLGYTPRSVTTWDEEKFLKNIIDSIIKN